MFRYVKNKLFVEDVPVEEISQKTGTPVYVYSKKKILENLNNYDKAFSSVRHILCYAMKANSNPFILREIFSTGAGVDITSGGELYRALKAGVSPGRVVFAGIGKSPEEIAYAARCGILMFNSESLDEVRLIDSIGRKLKKRLNVSFRINPDIDPHTHAYITTGKSENKFGIPLSALANVYIKTKRLSNVNISGIHCHIGSQITQIKPFALMAKVLAQTARKLLRYGLFLNYIDIGGGLGVNYKNETPPSPEKLANTVLPQIKNHCQTVIMEPGRYIVAESGVLVAKVLYRKPSTGKNFIIADAGMTDLIRPTLYGAYHEIIPVIRKGTPDKLPVDVVGPVCESGDFLGKNRQLPFLKAGDYIAVMNTGAYGFAMSSQYNSRPRAAEVLVDGKIWKIIRQRETYGNL